MNYKILRFPLYFTIPDVEKYNKHKTGYGYSVWDILRYSVYRGNEVYCLPLLNNNKKSDKIDGVNILPYSKSHTFKNFKKANIQMFKESLKYTKFKSHPYHVYFL